MSNPSTNPLTTVPVDYYPDFLKAVGPANEIFTQLDQELDWVQKPGVPRGEYYANDTNETYTYGQPPHARTYTPQIWHPVLLEIRTALLRLIGTNLDVCFANRYPTSRDHLGWHADDSPEMDQTAPIVTVSLGGERLIEFLEIGQPRETRQSLMLEHGSAAVMRPGMQQTWQHRIPKAGFVVGPRISLTYRRYIDPEKVDEVHVKPCTECNGAGGWYIVQGEHADFDSETCPHCNGSRFEPTTT